VPVQTSEQAAFVELFETAWRGGRDGFHAAWSGHLHEEVLLTQPLAPPARGPDGFRAQFDTLFDVMPDLSGEVLAWEPTDEGVQIDIRLRGTLAGSPVVWVSHDRIVIEDGRMRERHARFNPLPLVRAALLRPHVGVPLMLRARRSGGAAGAAGAATGPAGGGATAGGAATGGGLDRALAGLAVGRIVLGAASRLSPRGTARAFGAAGAAAPELDYMTRIFGARAIALGSGWLLSGGDARATWQRLAFGCDVSDTVAGIGHLRRRDIPRTSALMATALTGGYMLVGAAKVVRDLRGG
jgi:SnoaL-like protein